MSVPASHPPGRRSTGAIVFAVASVAAFAYLTATLDPPVTHLDTARDWLSARDCNRGDCPSWGPTASVLGLRQGALWIRVLAWGLGHDLDAMGLQRLLVALQALGAGALAWATARAGRTGWPAGLLVLVYVLGLRSVEPGDLLWNPALAHPGVALLAAGALGLATGGGLICALLAGLGAALAVLGHVLGLVLLPVLAWSLATARTRPLASLALGGVAFAGPVLLDSWQAVVANASALAAAGLAWAPPAAAATAAGVGLLLQRRLAAASDRAGVALLVVLALSAGFSAAIALPVALRAAWSPRFLFVLPPFLALAGTLVLDAQLTRLPPTVAFVVGSVAPPAALACGVAMWSSNDHAGPAAPWRLPEAERLAADLYGRGATYADLFRRLQGPWDRYLLGTLAGLDPAPDPVPVTADRAAESALLVLRLARADVPPSLPPGWRRVDVSPGYAALLREGPDGALPDGLELCPGATEAAAPCQGWDRTWRENDRQRPTFFDRLYPRVTPQEVCSLSLPAPTRWTVPLGPSTTPRTAWLPSPRWEGCAWRIAGATDPDGREVTLGPGRSLRLTLETAPDLGACPAACAPPPLVIAPADDPVARAFRTAGDPRPPTGPEAP
jgi:hypothetical protein